MPHYDISIIVPVYNAEQYLKECIDSIIAQTKKNIEIILVDDGSTDHSRDIILEYARKYESIIAVDNQTKGVIYARIAGLEKASGDYIGWVDSDDFVEPNMFQRLFDIMIEKDALVTYCDYSFFPAKVKEKEKWFKEYKGIKDWYFFERNTQCWNKLVSKTYIDEINLPQLYKVLDEYANLAVLLKTDRIAYTTEELYHYRVGIQSISGGSYKGKTKRFIHFAECASHMTEVLIDKYNGELGTYFEYRHIYSLLQVMIVASINNEKDAYKNAKKILDKIRFKKNSYTKTILDVNHGKLKSFVLRNILPVNYQISRMITRIVY